MAANDAVMHPAADIARREKAAAKYKPTQVKLLLLGEAPPCDTSRYFYFENVPKHDWLYVYVCKGLFGETPVAKLRAEKPAYLTRMRERGVFLIDLASGGMKEPTPKKLLPLVPDAVARAKALKPETMILIKSQIYDVAFQPLRDAGLRVIDARIPFPASGQQPAFLRGFRGAIEEAGWYEEQS